MKVTRVVFVIAHARKTVLTIGGEAKVPHCMGMPVEFGGHRLTIAASKVIPTHTCHKKRISVEMYTETTTAS